MKLDESEPIAMKRTLLRTGLFVFVLLTQVLASPQNNSYVKRALAYAKRLQVSQLDPKLPDRAFAQWFKEIVGPNSKIKWEVNDCGEQTGGPADIGRYFPTCVEADAKLPDNRSVVVRITVGTFHKGITGRPTLWDAFVEENNKTRTANKLSELSEVLAGNAK
jgi:hypothetical protein